MYIQRCPQNRVVQNDLVILYKKEGVTYTDNGTTGTYYKVTRTATKKYKYVDMTYQGAKNAANDLVTMYTRQEAHLRARASGQTVPSVVTFGNLKTKIAVTRVQGDIWEVDVNVSEEDVRASATDPSDPSTLFSAENLRDYDTQDEIVLQILSTDYDSSRRGLLIRTSNNMTDEQRAATVIMMRASSTATAWEQIGGLQWIDEDKIYLLRNDIVTGSTQIMLDYGDTTSNVYTITAAAPCVRIMSAQVYEDGSSGSILVNTDGDDFTYLAGMDIYMDSATSTNLSKYTGNKTYMTWEDGLCTISTGAPILQVMKDATRIMMIDSTHSSTNVTILKIETLNLSIDYATHHENYGEIKFTGNSTSLAALSTSTAYVGNSSTEMSAVGVFGELEDTYVNTETGVVSCASQSTLNQALAANSYIKVQTASGFTTNIQTISQEE